MKRALDVLLSGITTLIVISLLTFFLMKLVPGGPFDTGKAVPPEVLESLNRKFRLDLPWHEQYYAYMRDLVVHGDMGPSIKYIGMSVNEIVAESLPVSLELGTYALLISLTGGIFLGFLAALKKGTYLDLSAMMIAVSGVSLPSFLVAAIAILIFSQHLGWLPSAFWDEPVNKILPSIVLGLRPMAIIARLTRSSVLEVLNMDYVRTARAKGLSDLKVNALHVFKNSLIPVVTVIGPLAATILTGSFVIEFVFSVPGLGYHFIKAVTDRDFPLVMGVTMIYALFLVVSNTLVDWLYPFIDPRMKGSK
ncbi:MAG TPA: ABC transporter permease [Bdellovibrionota bacterium]|jgi:ABC-type dipeptide/oligopeptide/nickel transport system permease component|nr:ABC transporter permease [Bdellovibrionota bacterium]